MKTFRQFITEQSDFNNWSFPDEDTIRSDFEEYKKKEERKWEGRAKQMGFRYPIFENLEEFKSELQNAEVVTITDSFAREVEHLTSVNSLDELRSMVNSYKRPRDVDSIVKGFEENDPIPYPIILEGSNGMHIMAGNTRINAAKVLGITPEALLIDVKE